MCEIADGIIISFVILCALFDWKSREIPVWLLLLFSAAGVIGTLICERENAGSIGTGFVIGLCLLLVSKVTKEAIGYGDSWLITILGIYLGAKELLWVLLIAAFLAALAALYQMWRQGWDRKGSLPFVPFLAVGVMGVILL